MAGLFWYAPDSGIRLCRPRFRHGDLSFDQTVKISVDPALKSICGLGTGIFFDNYTGLADIRCTQYEPQT